MVTLFNLLKNRPTFPKWLHHLSVCFEMQLNHILNVRRKRREGRPVAHECFDCVLIQYLGNVSFAWIELN